MMAGRILGILTVLALVALFAYGLTRDASLIPSPLVGNPAPDFELERLDAPGTVRFSDLRGRVTVVNFWASWCLACIQEHPSLVRAWQRYRGPDFELVGIVYQDTPENARRYLSEHGGGWTQLLDPGSRAALEFGVYGVPETFFIDRNGVISHKHIGPVNDSLLATEIEKLQASRQADSTGAGATRTP